MTALKIRRIGNSLGVVLPKETLRDLGVGENDTLYLSRVPEGGVKLSVATSSFEQRMEVARRGMAKYREALKELAK